MVEILEGILYGVCSVIAWIINAFIDFFQIDPFPGMAEGIGIEGHPWEVEAIQMVKAIFPFDGAMAMVMSFFGIVVVAIIISVIWNWAKVKLG